MMRWWVVALVVSGCGRWDFTDDPALVDASGTTSDAGGTVMMTFGERTGAQHTGVTTDTWLSSTSPTANFGGDDNFTVSPTSVGLLRFDLGAIPPSTTVVAAELHIMTEDVGLSSGSVQLFAVREAWTEGASQGAAGVANYTQRMAGTAWSNAGAGTPNSRSATVLAQFTPSTLQTDYTVPLGAAGVAAIQGWVNAPGTNAGFALGVTAGGGTVGFQSSEVLPASGAPLLVITVQ